MHPMRACMHVGPLRSIYMCLSDSALPAYSPLELVLGPRAAQRHARYASPSTLHKADVCVRSCSCVGALLHKMPWAKVLALLRAGHLEGC
jgi:hypothetical protein